MIGLFSVALTSVFTSTISWGVNKLLDSIISCHQCGKQYTLGVTNTNHNTISCYNCGHSLQEYVNATNHTVNRNQTVVTSAISNMRFPDWKGMFELYYDVDVINSFNQEIVVEIVLGKFNGTQFYKNQLAFTPRGDYWYWTELWWKIPVSEFPNEACTVAIDLNLYNIWGDKLDIQRRLMNYYGKG